MQIEREEALAVWSAELSCFEDTCNHLYDHFTKEELHTAYHNHHYGPELCFAGCRFDQELDDDTTEEALNKMQILMEASHGDLWGADHYGNCSQWEAKTGSPFKIRQSFFKRHQALLGSHFGVNAWVSNDYRRYGKHKWWESSLRQGTTIAYLTLPETSTHQTSWDCGIAKH